MSDAHNASNSANLRCLSTSLVALDEMDEARQVGRRLLNLVPTFRLTTFRARTPLPGAVRDKFAERLKLAGLPE